MITAPVREVNRRARRLLRQLRGVAGGEWVVEVRAGVSEVGAGALPLTKIPTQVVSVRSGCMSASAIEHSFRRQDPAVLGRIQQDVFLLDMRMVQDHELPDVVQAFRRVCGCL
jgi:L-seryl-tRNA(Ser) seleniumtransferase